MKKFTRVILVICGILTVAGLTVGIVGFAMGGRISDIDDGSFVWNRGFRWGTAKKVDWENTFEGIKKLDVDIGVLEVDFEEYDGDVIQIEAQDVPEKLTCKKDQDTLVINDSAVGKRWGMNNDSPQINVLVPRNMEFEEVKINVGVGSLDASGLRSKKTEIECGVGEVDIEGWITGDTKLTCGVGSISLNLNGSESDFNYKIGSGVGDVSIGDQSFSGLEHNKTIDNDAQNEMEVSCGVGDVDVSFDDNDD